MFDRFTDRAKKVIELAHQEARSFNHEYLGTEHILLGLVQEGSGVAANVLKNMGIDLAKIRNEVEKFIKTGPSVVTMGQLPFTPRAKRVLELSMEEASNFGHNWIGDEHLLLGMIKENEGIAAQALLSLGLTVHDLRERVLEFLSPDTDNGPVDEGAVDRDLLAEDEERLQSYLWLTTRPAALRLLIDPGTASAEEVGELLAEVSTLYRMMGGSGITFTHTGTKCPEYV